MEDLYTKAVESSKGATTSIWNAEKNLFKLLNLLTLEIEFGEIVETGVANGITTKSIMWALNSNNSKASLYSFDVLPETRYSYDGEGTWNFRLLKGRNKHGQLKSEVKNLNNIRLWIHDSDHSYKWQKFEYKLALLSLPDGGILISDDIDTSSAWIEVVPKNFSSNFVIFDSRKFIGIAIK